MRQYRADTGDDSAIALHPLELMVSDGPSAQVLSSLLYCILYSEQ
jgi:hypothetical protein